MNIFYFLLLFKYSKLSPLGILFILCTKKIIYIKKFIYTSFFCLIPLYGFIIKGFLVDFYNGSIEVIFHLTYILSFTLFGNIKYDIYNLLKYIRDRKIKYNLILISSLLIVYLIPFLYPVRDTLYTIIYISEFSKCLLLANGLINKNSMIGYLDFFPICYVLLEAIIVRLDNSGAVILACSYFVTVIFLKFIDFFKKLILNFRLSKSTFYITLFTLGLIFIVINNEISRDLFYKFRYVSESLILVFENENFDLEYLYDLSLTRTFDSVFYRIMEVLNVIFDISNEERFFGSLISTHTNTAIIAHFPQATLFFKYGINSVLMNILLFINLFKINKYQNKDKKNFNVNFIPLLPILISDSKGEFLYAFFFGAALMTLKENLILRLSSQKNSF